MYPRPCYCNHDKVTTDTNYYCNFLKITSSDCHMFSRIPTIIDFCMILDIMFVFFLPALAVAVIDMFVRQDQAKQRKKVSHTIWKSSDHLKVRYTDLSYSFPNQSHRTYARTIERVSYTHILYVCIKIYWVYIASAYRVLDKDNTIWSYAH